MEQDEINNLVHNNEIKDSLVQIRKYLETDIYNLTKEVREKDEEIKIIKEDLQHNQHMMEGNAQLINKLLGDMSKLQNDIEWYKRTYEKRSFFGVILEKLFNRTQGSK
jgi:hypothetical protein